ncbi:MAG: CHAD domain-containing protein [Solirubrobacteraceae bacterium]
MRTGAGERRSGVRRPERLEHYRQSLLSYRLSLSDDIGVPAALRAVAGEQIADAIRVLRDERANDPVTAVHDARKDLKKTRSLLRLARPDLPRKAYRAENAALRDIARRLSDVRDADVMVETVDALAERFVGQLPRLAFTTVRRRFATAAQHAHAAADAAVSQAAIAELAEVARRVANWPLDGCDTATLGAGAALAHARGRRLLAAAQDAPTPESLHEWRKRVKDLWYHARLLEEAWPGVLGAFAEGAHALSDLLGDDHDLGVLADRLAAGTWPPSVDDEALLGLVAQRRAELQARAWHLCERLYAERPKAFARRLRVYLDAK